MSDEEDRSREVSEEEVDDLFGDDVGESASKIQDEDSQDEDERELKTIDISLPRHAISSKPEDDTYSLKMPVFLSVEAHPFDPNEFKEKVNQSSLDRSKTELTDKQIKDELIAEKLINENTIRWRYSNSGNDEIIKQSNAHFVQWDDGSISLKIGTELFDFKELPLTDTFLVKTHDSYEILQNDSIINKTVNLLPASNLTSAHRKLALAVKNTQRKGKILNTITDDDPLMKQRLADENERKTLKLRRQIESKRRLQQERIERGSVPSSRGAVEREPAYERFARTYGGGDEYDEEDDFVANDDEEEGEEEEDEEEEEEEYERAAERLKKVKDDGASKYKNREEDEPRKRRRIIESDEEE